MRKASLVLTIIGFVATIFAAIFSSINAFNEYAYTQYHILYIAQLVVTIFEILGSLIVFPFSLKAINDRYNKHIAIGVLTIIFVSPIGGILYLCCKPEYVYVKRSTATTSSSLNYNAPTNLFTNEEVIYDEADVTKIDSTVTSGKYLYSSSIKVADCRGLKRLPSGVFRHSSIKILIIDKELEEIGEYAFEDCFYLRNIIYYGSKESFSKIRLLNNNASFKSAKVLVKDEDKPVESTDAIEKIERAKKLLDSGVITQEEFDKIKADALSKL